MSSFKHKVFKILGWKCLQALTKNIIVNTIEKNIFFFEFYWTNFLGPNVFLDLDWLSLEENCPAGDSCWSGKMSLKTTTTEVGHEWNECDRGPYFSIKKRRNICTTKVVTTTYEVSSMYLRYKNRSYLYFYCFCWL